MRMLGPIRAADHRMPVLIRGHLGAAVRWEHENLIPGTYCSNIEEIERRAGDAQ